MRLKDYNVGPPGGWAIPCPRCSGKQFAAATFSSLLGAVTRHYLEAFHPLNSVREEVEDALCQRVGGSFQFVKHSNSLLLLGRYGDIVNLLPLAYGLSKRGPVKWIVGTEFADILEGVSYVEPIVKLAGPDSLPSIIKETRNHNPRVAQCWKNPDQRRLMDSFCKESWRLAGALEDFGRWPLVFDRRDKFREEALIESILSETIKFPVVLAATSSVSSPYTNKLALLQELQSSIAGTVIDLDFVKAEKPFDLLGLIEIADALVTVDTLHLHLARACNTPVIALLNQGWLASTPPPQTFATFPYNCPVENVTLVVEQLLGRKAKTCVVTGNPHGDTQRHKDAMASWPNHYMFTGGRWSDSIGDPRHLPYAKDILVQCLHETNEDVIIWTNTDVTFKDYTVPRIIEHARRFDFGCARRDKHHIGREIFWFTREWLSAHINQMPDVIWGAPKPDLIWARWLRGQRGISTTINNLYYDFPPVELPPGLIYHEPHRSAWLDHQQSAAAIHNETLWANL